MKTANPMSSDWRNTCIIAAFLLLCCPIAFTSPADALDSLAWGSPRATVSVEMYIDFQCVDCRAFWLETLPLLKRDYVDTGKLRVTQRHLPIVRHQWSKLAAQYAVAAGILGRSEVVTQRLFEAQADWSASGNVDLALAGVLSESEVQRVRQLMQTDPRVEALIDADLERAHREGISADPSLQITAKGYNQHMSGSVPYAVLKSYLNHLLSSLEK